MVTVSTSDRGDSSPQLHQHRLSMSNSLESGVIRGWHHQGRGKGEWSKAGVIRGSDQVDKLDRVVMGMGSGGVIK